MSDNSSNISMLLTPTKAKNGSAETKTRGLILSQGWRTGRPDRLPQFPSRNWIMKGKRRTKEMLLIDVEVIRVII